MDSLIEAAELLKNQADIIFILVSGGREKENLANQASLLSNKLFDYLYAEKSILYAIESGKYLPVDDAKVGVSTPAEDPKAIAGAILKLKTLSPEERNKMEQNGHEYALKNHYYAKLSVKLAHVLLGEK